ncbi:MAG: type 1 glutamine amidotransferase [Chloroflexi bacterium]|nr:type 1 glutamine amidotransferase [Chloroflexota bacterium]
MPEKRLDGFRVAILVADGFEQSEMTEPRQALDHAGAKTVLVSPKPGEVHGMRHHAKADAFTVDVTLDQANPDDFDALLLPGGALNADALRANHRALDFVRRFDATGRSIAAICHAPWVLISAGLVHGRILTSYHTIQDDVRNAGGHWLDLAPVRDRNWVTARSPKDLAAFNPEMVALFAEQKGKGLMKLAA